MNRPSDSGYSMPVCILIAVAPLFLAFLIIYLSPPLGVILPDWRPLNWLADYIVIWPLVWISADILRAGQWVWYQSGQGIKLNNSLRLTGGFLLIFICVWLVAVPLINQFAIRYPRLRIDPASYSQLFRFLFGAAGALLVRLAHHLVCKRRLKVGMPRGAG